MRLIAAVAALWLACPHGQAQAKPRLVSWGPGASSTGIRLWTFRGDAKKRQKFALVSAKGLVGTATVVAVEAPYADKPCYRIASATTKESAPRGGELVAYGPIDKVPAKARVVPVPASFTLAAERDTSALDVDGDGAADLV